LIGSQRSKRNAILGFLLVTALVLGGMIWATVSTLQLARVDLQVRAAEERHQNIRLAVSRIEDVYKLILAVENGRPYKDYRAYTNPSAALSPEGEAIDPLSFYTPSPLVEGRSAEWIDLYFQVDPEGLWTSPQLVDPASRFAAHLDPEDQFFMEVARERLERLSAALPDAVLRPRLAAAYEAQRWAQPLEHPSSTARELTAAGLAADQRAPSARDKQLARRALRQSNRLKQQLSELAQQSQSCEPQDVVRNVISDNGFVIPDDASSADILVEPQGLVPIWLAGLEGEDAKLLFVREVRADDEQLYQGFTVRWDLLKPKLLDALGASPASSDPFAEADLRVVADAASADHTDETFIDTLSVRLTIPDPPPPPAGEAWKAVRVTLLTTWGAAIVMLVIAGIGFRNLVALTDRRLQFAYAVTHELRTPLTTFQLYSDMLAAGMVPEESKQEYFDTLNNESQRLSDLVAGVLEYARLENQKVRLNPVKTDGQALEQFLQGRFEEHCKRSEVRLKVESTISNSYPLLIDTEVVSQIMGVLVNNACRHARVADDPAVLIRLSRYDRGLRLDVIDSGHGIDRADTRRVFQPFRRGQKAGTSAPSGIGLGLSLARSWAKLLGGRLELASRSHPELGGAHFRLTVPDMA